MGEIVTLRSDLPAPLVDGVSVDLVETLENLLGKAQRGEIIAMGFSLVYADKKSGSGWSNSQSTNGCMAEGILDLMYRYMSNGRKES